MKIKILVESGLPDVDGNVVSLENITIPDDVVVLLDFKEDQPICRCVITKENESLFAELDCPEKYHALYPAICFSHSGSETIETESGFKTVWKNPIIRSLGLCGSPNLNPEIKTIRDQIA